MELRWRGDHRIAGRKSCGTVYAIWRVASLTHLVKTPPPTLLRARFATVLEHLPSVPSVVLPFESLVETDRAFVLLNQVLQAFYAMRRPFVQYELPHGAEVRRFLNLT